MRDYSDEDTHEFTGFKANVSTVIAVIFCLFIVGYLSIRDRMPHKIIRGVIISAAIGCLLGMLMAGFIVNLIERI